MPEKEFLDIGPCINLCTLLALKLSGDCINTVMEKFVLCKWLIRNIVTLKYEITSRLQHLDKLEEICIWKSYSMSVNRASIM